MEVFPRLERLGLSTRREVDLTSLLNSNSSLKVIHLKGSNFKGLGYLFQGLEGASSVLLERVPRSLGWRSRPVTEAEEARYEFSCNGQHHFWTSEEDYRTLRRLKTFEKEALRSHKYIFKVSPLGYNYLRPSTPMFEF
jgi:hypothetical protein